MFTILWIFTRLLEMKGKLSHRQPLAARAAMTRHDSAVVALRGANRLAHWTEAVRDEEEMPPRRIG